LIIFLAANEVMAREVRARSSQLGRQQALVLREQRQHSPFPPRDPEPAFAQTDDHAAGRPEQMAQPIEQQVIQGRGSGEARGGGHRVYRGNN
jgi:hypothetical protein